MTQHELANAIGVPQPSIARIESGTVVPRTATLITILEATGQRLTVEPIGPSVDPEVIRRQLAMTVPRRTRDALGRVAKDPTTSPVRILRRLRRFGVPFVLVGELAEVAHGAPGTIGPLIEVCVASTEVARERLALAQDDLGAAADASHLSVLSTTAAGDDYDVLVRNAVGMPVESGIRVRVAALEDLIRARRALGTPQDEDAAAVLRAIVDEEARSGRPPSTPAG
jgi:DNA-binding XRE family transcriptional regulator